MASKMNLIPLPIMSVETKIDIDGYEYQALIDYTYDDIYKEYDVERVQLEVFDGHYADLQSKGFGVVEKLMTKKEFWDE